MKKSKKNAKPAVRRHRFPITKVVVVAIVLAAAGITVASRQLATNKVTKIETATVPVSREAAKNYVTVKVAGREVQVDPQTGKIKPLTPEEAQQLADGLKTMLNKSTEGLEQVQQGDGTVSMDLKGRFRNVAVARTNDDGSVEESCVDEPEQAAAFFGIDPKLLGVQSTRTLSAQPVVKTPARKVSQ